MVGLGFSKSGRCRIHLERCKIQLPFLCCQPWFVSTGLPRYFVLSPPILSLYAKCNASWRELLRAPSNIAGAPSKQWMGENSLPRRPFPEEPYSGIIPEDTFSGKFPEEDGVIPEELRNTFRKNMFLNVSGRRFFRKTTFFFRKKGLPEFFFLKMVFFVII